MTTPIPDPLNPHALADAVEGVLGDTRTTSGLEASLATEAGRLEAARRWTRDAVAQGLTVPGVDALGDSGDLEVRHLEPADRADIEAEIVEAVALEVARRRADALLNDDAAEEAIRKFHKRHGL